MGTNNWTTSSRWRAAGITSAAGEDTLQFSILLNRSGAAQNYFNPVTSSTTALADDDMVIFAYNTVDNSVAQFSSFTGSLFGTGNPTTMWFYHASNVNVEMGLDNLGYYPNELTVVIPEPATLALGALGLALLVPRRRRAE